MELLQQGLTSLTDFIMGTVAVIILVGGSIYFTCMLKGVQFRMIPEMFRLLKEDSQEKKKGISSFQAFMMSTATRIGTGNLAGVATAIVGGGPGAIFWMWIMSFIGSASAFVESTLAQIYKEKDGDSFCGGPSYYIRKALGSPYLAITFATLITIAFGFIFNSVASNTITASITNVVDINPAIIGLFLVGAVGIVIFGGAKRIAHVSSILVPVMATIYLIVALFVVISNISQLPAVFELIIKNAFGMEQVIGGGIGAAVSFGVKRGLFSNEAGMGSAPNAAATATVSHPVKQGLIQTLSVFTDTLIICTATAFIILLSGQYTSGANGIILTQNALAENIGSWASPFMMITTFLFAFTTIIGSYYYGEANIPKDNKTVMLVYRIAVLAMIFFGTMVEMSIVWTLADLAMGIMTIINMYAILRLSPIVKAVLNDYMAQKKAGLNPQFYQDTIPGLTGIDAWPTQQETQENVA
ncbi:MAG: alanine/glycine:cation symporter family protein [Bacillaceae bacterium]